MTTQLNATPRFPRDSNSLKTMTEIYSRREHLPRLFRQYQF